MTPKQTNLSLHLYQNDSIFWFVYFDIFVCLSIYQPGKLPKSDANKESLVLDLGSMRSKGAKSVERIVNQWKRMIQ